MRTSLLAALLLLCASCRVAVPQPPGLKIKIKAAVHVDARVPPPPPVALQGADVVEFFGIPLDGAQDIVFVLDRSGSMNEPAQGRLAQLQPAAAPPPPPPPDPSTDPQAAPPPPVTRKIDAAHQELIDALERLPAGTRLNVIFFNDSLEGFAPNMVALDDSDKDSLIAFVREMTPAGATALAPAMRVAFLMNAKRIVLLSDGLGNIGGGPGALLRDAREAIHGGVRIDTIGLGSHQNAALLQALADESGGLYQAL